MNMTSIRSFDLQLQTTFTKPKKVENVANIAFCDVCIIMSQVTIVFTRRFMQLIERESGELEIRDGTCGKNEKGETFGRQIGKQLA